MKPQQQSGGGFGQQNPQKKPGQQTPGAGGMGGKTNIPKDKQGWGTDERGGGQGGTGSQQR